MEPYFSITGDVCHIPFADLCMRNKTYQPYFIHKTYRASECIHDQGTPIEDFGIVKSGILKAVNNTLNGVELCHAYFQAKDIFPEFLYFTGTRQYIYSLYAVKRAEVVWIPVAVMEEMLSKDPQLMHSMMLYISHRGLKNQMYLNCLNYQTIRERIAYWIVGMHGIALEEVVRIPSSQSILANLLHVSRSSLNQELKQMEREGFFKITQREVTSVDVERLSSLL